MVWNFFLHLPRTENIFYENKLHENILLILWDANWNCQVKHVKTGETTELQAYTDTNTLKIFLILLLRKRRIWVGVCLAARQYPLVVLNFKTHENKNSFRRWKCFCGSSSANLSETDELHLFKWNKYSEMVVRVEKNWVNRQKRRVCYKSGTR